MPATATRGLKTVFVAIGALLVTTGGVRAGGPTEQSYPGQNIETFAFKSKVTGADQVIWIYTPPGYKDTSTAYPVLYLTDSRHHFDHTVTTSRFLSQRQPAPKAMVVGLLSQDRFRDLTPTPDLTLDKRYRNSGGAGRFLKFLADEVIPHVDRSYRTTGFRMLAGHSLGGLFALHALMTRPDLFDAYILSDPSIWWERNAYTEKIRAFFKNTPGLSVSVYASQSGPINKNFTTFETILRSYRSDLFRFATRRFPDETHISVPLMSYYSGLKALFGGWRMPLLRNMTLVDDPIPRIKRYHQNLSQQFKTKVRPSEWNVNHYGYAYLKQGHAETALAVMQYNHTLYPQSANVHDSLGEVYEALGRFQEAHAHYRRAHALARKAAHRMLPLFEENLRRIKKRLKGDRGGH